jgi:hypothetical protein
MVLNTQLILHDINYINCIYSIFKSPLDVKSIQRNDNGYVIFQGNAYCVQQIRNKLIFGSYFIRFSAWTPAKLFY